MKTIYKNKTFSLKEKGMYAILESISKNNHCFIAISCLKKMTSNSAKNIIQVLSELNKKDGIDINNISENKEFKDLIYHITLKGGSNAR